MKKKVDDYYNNGIIEVARIGEHILQRNLLPANKRNKLISTLAADEPVIRTQINSLVSQIRNKVLGFEPLQLLNMSQRMFLLINCGITSDIQQTELDDMALSRVTEYVQSILVSSAPISQDYFDDPFRQFCTLISDIKQLHQLIQQYYLALGAFYAKNDAVEDDVARDILLAQIFFIVRGKRYQVFEAEYYEYLLSSHNEMFENLFHITSNDIIDGTLFEITRRFQQD